MDNDYTHPAIPVVETREASSIAEGNELPPQELTARCFEAFGDAVRSKMRWVSGSAADAEEITQEAFLRFYDKLLAGEKIASPEAWILTTARNELSKRRRERRRRGPVFEERVARFMMHVAESRMPPTNPEEQLQARERDVALRRAVRSLPERDRMLLAERAAGVTLRAIAARYGFSNFRRAGEAMLGVIARVKRRL